MTASGGSGQWQSSDDPNEQTHDQARHEPCWVTRRYQTSPSEHQVKLALLPGSANPRLAQAIAGLLGEQPTQCHHEHFPDGEQHVEILESVRGSDVYVIQPTSPPVDPHLVELLLLGDAARRAGAARLTAVVPYLGYARQDRRAKGRESVASRLVADLIQPAFDRVIALDVHTSSIEGFFWIPIEHLSAVTVLAESVRAARLPKSVIVAPDLGAVKLAERYAAILDLPVAVVRKRRVSAKQVTVTGVVGDVAGRSPIIVDDMISTGATIAAALETLSDARCAPNIIVVATHGLFVGPAVERLLNATAHKLIVTDSVALSDDLQLPVQVASVAPLLANAVGRLHRDQSLKDLIAHG
jgi:ribose-phosphate pyrophosphokinase